MEIKGETGACDFSPIVDRICPGEQYTREIPDISRLSKNGDDAAKGNEEITHFAGSD
jgi:hypothetical protein